MSPDAEPLVLSRLQGPLGEMLAVTGRDGALRALEFADHAPRLHRLLALHNRRAGRAVRPSDGPAPPALADTLARYFAGELTALDTLGVRTWGTPFQERVWAALRTIPAGHTVSYLGLATRVGHPSAVRAVAMANAANPVGIVVPCHRVIATGGALGGYAGGTERKRWLLAHEGVSLAR
jgi:methylated-DNA-[protein]-cysteine S-methyltransferase